MTTTVRVHVNGPYKATVKVTKDGEPLGDEIVIGPQEERQLPHFHGNVMGYEITEKPVEGDAKS